VSSEADSLGGDRRKKTHRLILPLGMRVLVQVLRDEDRTDAGLYLPAGAKEAQDQAMYGKVIEVARDKPTTDVEAENVSGIPNGANVLFKKRSRRSRPVGRSVARVGC